MQFRRNLKHFFLVTGVSFLLIFSTLRLFGENFSVPLTHFFIYREGQAFLDLLYKYSFAPSKDIVIINIDDTTLNSFQAQSDLKMLTIPKTIYSNLIESLQGVSVRGIAFDIVFQNIDTEEEAFRDVLLSHTGVAIATTLGTGDACHDDKDGKYTTCDGVPRSVYSGALWGFIGIGGFADRLVPIQDISLLPFASWKETKLLDTLALALYRREFPDKILPFEENKNVLMPFFGGPGTYPTYSLSDVISMKKVDLVANFSKKYIFVGEAGTLIHDQHLSPVTGTFIDGVETHAHFLDGLLQERFLREYTLRDISFFIFFLIFLAFVSGIYVFAPKYIGFCFAVLLSLGIIGVSRYLYFDRAIVIEIAPLLLAGSVISFPTTFIYRFFIVDREKRALANAFSHYVDPVVVKKIGESARSIELGGETRELSILFSDIAGFTTISEKIAVTDLFLLMSSYLSKMTDILTKNGGTLDKYIGDAVMGFFGAPITLVDHAKRACQTALDMRNALPAYNSELLTRGLESIDFRVGIASGEVMVGNIGSRDRFNYTVLGDTVNLASRLEATSKEYGTHIIVSEGTYLLTKEVYYYRKLDLITVKGKNEPIGIYELIGDIHDTEMETVCFDEYARALDLYMQGNYIEAGRIWELQMNLDPPSRTMALRCVDILQGNLIVEKGVFHMTKK